MGEWDSWAEVDKFKDEIWDFVVESLLRRVIDSRGEWDGKICWPLKDMGLEVGDWPAIEGGFVGILVNESKYGDIFKNKGVDVGNV